MTTFEDALAELGSALARIAAAYERDRSLREDLLQEILLALFRALPALADRTKLRAFAFRIAHNRCVDHVIRQAAAPRATELPDKIASDDPSPEEALLAGERAERLLEAMRTLELPYRQVMTLVLEDLSYVEIAETLGISLANVGVRVNRAKSRLKAALNHE